LRPCDKPLREKELRSIIVLPLTKEQMTEAQLYKTVYQHVLSVAHPRQPYVQFNDRTIVLGAKTGTGPNAIRLVDYRLVSAGFCFLLTARLVQ
jgi:hypothetical protein